MLLDQLPIEVHSIICKFVCLAGIESTPRTYQAVYSLCLVSRHFYSIAVPIMYQTLLVDGRTKISLLARTIQTRPDLGECAMHMFLSDYSQRTSAGRSSGEEEEDAFEMPPSFAFERPFSREGRIERLQRLQNWLHERAQRVAAFRSAVQSILNAVSPNLRTLSICLYGHYDENADSGLADALARPFPFLSELTIRDNVHPFPSTRIELPVLENLHLAGGSLLDPLTTLDALVKGCPSLKCIRLTEPFLNDLAVNSLERIVDDITTSHIYTHEQSDSTSKSKLKSKLDKGVDRVVPHRRVPLRIILEPCPYNYTTSVSSTNVNTNIMHTIPSTSSSSTSIMSGHALSNSTALYNGLTALSTRSQGVFDLNGGWPELTQQHQRQHTTSEGNSHREGRGSNLQREDRYPLERALNDWVRHIMTHGE